MPTHPAIANALEVEIEREVVVARQHGAWQPERARGGVPTVAGYGLLLRGHRRHAPTACWARMAGNEISGSSLIVPWM